MIQEVKLPELGENIEKATVVSVLVSVGDRVEKEQGLLEVETEKASMEVPSPADGKVTKIHVTVGDEVAVGQLLLTLDTEGIGSQAETPPPEPDRKDQKEEQPLAAKEEPDAVEARPAEVAEPPPAAQAASESPAPPAPAAPPSELPAPAAPSVRRLARELGVNINEVRGSGPAGRISAEDVKKHSKEILQGNAPAMLVAGQPANVALPDLSVFGEVERQPITSVRRLTAESMARSWAIIPHVTQQDRADVTDLEAMRKRYSGRVEAAGGKLTVTAIVLKTVASALRKFPKFNAALDVEKREVVFRRYVNIGVAVDTERGLLVPVVRDADRKNITEIAAELNDLAERARAKKLAPDEMHGAGFTVSNLGGLGTTYFSPIVNWPEPAILGVGRAATEAVWQDGVFVPRLILPLSVSYDHRLVDGAEAARFLRWVAEALEHPLLLALEG